jgi:hypothetical protein
MKRHSPSFYMSPHHKLHNIKQIILNFEVELTSPSGKVVKTKVETTIDMKK